MRLSDESKAFHYCVYQVVKQIPYGRVISYGHIAYLLGKPQNSRQVGSSLKNFHIIARQLNEESADESIDIEALPWWRVVSSAGKISPRDNTNGMVRQKQFLVEEGVDVLDGYIVDLETYGWLPDEVDL